MSLLPLSLLLALVSLLPATTAQCDANSTFYFPPALSQTSQTLLNQPVNNIQVAEPNVLYVFPMMFNSQCSVTQIEFCYQYSNLINLPVFTLYLFEGSNANQLSGSRVFSATPTPSPLKVCNDQLQRCCERQPVASDMFSVPSSFVFGAAQASGSSQHTLLDFSIQAFPVTYNIHNVAVIGTNTELLGSSSGTIRGLRMVRFIIDPDAMPTTTSTTAPSDTTSSQQPTPTGPSTESSTRTGAIAAGVIVSLLVGMGIGVAVAVVAVVLWKRSRSRGKSSLGPVSADSGFDHRLSGGEAYPTAISIEPNEAYASPITTQQNEVYSNTADIHTDGNEAYATTDTTTATGHEYDYITV